MILEDLGALFSEVREITVILSSWKRKNIQQRQPVFGAVRLSLVRNPSGRSRREPKWHKDEPEGKAFAEKVMAFIEEELKRSK